MFISLDDQNKLCKHATSIIEIANKYKITDLWVIPPIGEVSDYQVDLMFNYDKEQAPSISDIVQMYREIKEVFKFNFEIVWHNVNNVIEAASRADEGPYYARFLEAIDSAIPISMMLSDTPLSEQFKNISKQTKDLSNHEVKTTEPYIPLFQRMSVSISGDAVHDTPEVNSNERRYNHNLYITYQ